MRVRKIHNKSRLGCSQCKKRRVKCDGKQPRCASCEKRALDCSFLLLAPMQRLPIAPLSPLTEVAVRKQKDDVPYEIHVFRQREDERVRVSVPSVDPDSPEPPPGHDSAAVIKLPQHLRLGDPWKDILITASPDVRCLIDHYQNVTCPTLADNHTGQLIWQFFVPELAANHIYLFHGVLSVVALHLSGVYADPIQKRSMIRIAVGEMNRSLKYYRPAVKEINQTTAASLFIGASLTAVFVIQTASNEMEETLAIIPHGYKLLPQDTIGSLVQSLTRISWSLRGALSILAPGWKWVNESRLKTLCNRKWPRPYVPANQQALEEDRRLCHLETLWINPARDYEEHFECLTNVLQSLRDIFALVSQLTIPYDDSTPGVGVPYSVDNVTMGILKDKSAVFTWPCTMPAKFFKLLEQKDRDALVILAHWAILVERIRDVWWVDGLGSSIITSIAIIIGRNYWHLLDWPTTTIGLDLENRFG